MGRVIGVTTTIIGRRVVEVVVGVVIYLPVVTTCFLMLTVGLAVVVL